MSGHDGEARLPPNTSQRLRGARRAESLVFWATLVAAIVIQYLLLAHAPRSAHGRLVFGGIAFALAAVAILLAPVFNKLPAAPARLVLEAARFLLGLPSVLGSVLLVAALFQVAGYHVAVFVVVTAGLCLWALLFLPLAVLIGRTAAHA